MTVTGSSFYSNDGYGINAGSRSFIKETAVHFNGDTGIIAGAGSEILQCGVTENEGGGILCGEYLNVSVSLRRGNGITIEGCNVSGNQGTGVRALGGDGLTIRKCDIHQNGGAGIKVTPASGSSCNSVTISHCNISENNEYGIDFTIGSGSDTQSDGNRIMHNTVTRNSVTSPVPHGIHLKRVNDSRIEGNHVVGRVEISGDATVFSGFGIADPNSSNGNFFLKNTVKSFFKNYAFNGNSVYGPIISPGTGMPGSAGELSDTGKGAHPWANFSF
jgi:parallel beta-helix repeat protein